MKRFTTVSLLLAGLIVSCTARNIEVDINNRERGSSSSDESSESMELIRQTGSNEVFEAMTVSVATFRICLNMKSDVIGLVNDLDHLNASTRHFFFPKYCPHVLSCLEPPMKQFIKSMHVDIIQPRSHNAMLEVLDLVCENDGEILFRDEAYEVCMKYIPGYIVECAAVLVSESTKIMDISKHSETKCGEFAEARDCMSKSFNECNGSSLIDVMDVYLRAMFKDSPCRNMAVIGVESEGAGGARHPHELVWHSLRICLIFVLYMLLICIQQSTINVTG